MASPSVTAVTKRELSTNPTAIQQRISSGGHFDGTLPQAAGPVRADSPLYTPGNSIYKYAAATAGGLFFWNTVEPLIISQINVDLGGSANVSVVVVNLDPTHINDDAPTVLAGESITIASSTSVTLLALNDIKQILLPYQALQIVTTASAAAQIARVIGSLERTFVR